MQIEKSDRLFGSSTRISSREKSPYRLVYRKIAFIKYYNVIVGAKSPPPISSLCGSIALQWASILMDCIVERNPLA